MEATMSSTSYWKRGPVKLTMTALNVEDHKTRIICRMKWNDKIVFEGRDFFAPLGWWPIGERARLNLLAFLTLQDGDTDAEYFEGYTPEQLAWRESRDCEELGWWVSDREERMNKNAR
jgi:hypothetical protein